MGGKYHIRTDEATEFGSVTDYYVNNLLEVLKLIVTKKKQLIFVTRFFS